ncbi:MAG: biotin/lipoyl-binding protein, partial [Verrucomicrobiia bacterium]
MKPDTEPSAATASAEPLPAVANTGSRQRFIPLVVALGLLIIGVVAVYYFVAVRSYESTDDAFIDGHAIQISPQVSGHVLAVLINDNQFVKKGDPLVQIDPRDYDVALAQARANLAAAQSRLAQAQHQVIVSRAKAEQERAAVGVAEAEATRAEADLARYQNVE